MEKRERKGCNGENIKKRWREKRVESKEKGRGKKTEKKRVQDDYMI